MALDRVGSHEAIVRAAQDQVQSELWKLRGGYRSYPMNPQSASRIQALEWWQAKLRRCADDARAMDDPEGGKHG
jgi:hypothetical protein